MDEQQEKIAAFLKAIFLFSDLSDERIWELAGQCRLVSLVTGERLYFQDKPADKFFIVWDGKIRLAKGRGPEKRSMDTLIRGDFFGEDLIVSKVRTEEAFAMGPARVLEIDEGVFFELYDEAPRVRTILDAIRWSRELVHNRTFKWVREDEAIYLIARKHRYFLYVSLLLPFLLLFGSIVVATLGFASTAGPSLMVWVGAAGVAAALLWAGWQWLDWSNDYYIVTNQRVLWVEKVVLLYDSRQEAPLSTVLSTIVVSNQLLRSFIDYGTLIIRTYTASITLRRADHPGLFTEFIKGLQSRARELAQKAEEEAMDSVIQERLRRRSGQGWRPQPPKVQALPAQRRGFNLQEYLETFLKVRYEKGDVITYRKHWLILIQKTILPALANLTVVLLAGYLWMQGIYTGAFALLSWIGILLVTGTWWLYHYVDWRNDVYVVTRENILDIERKPLSREEKKSAPLGNILSLQHTREGIIGLLFNFGTVIINIGTEKFDFYAVFNPAQVQYEIFDRMYALQQRKEAENAARERARIADWLVAYHRQAEKLEDVEKNSDGDGFSG